MPGDVSQHATQRSMLFKVIEIQANMLSPLIGPGGETIKKLQISNDTIIQIGFMIPGEMKKVSICGSDPVAVDKTIEEICNLLEIPISQITVIEGNSI